MGSLWAVMQVACEGRCNLFVAHVAWKRVPIAQRDCERTQRTFIHAYILMIINVGVVQHIYAYVYIHAYVHEFTITKQP